MFPVRWDTWEKGGSRLGQHTSRPDDPGIEGSTRRVGHSTYIAQHGGLGVSPPSEEFIAISTGVEHTLHVKLHLFGCPPEPTAIFSWSSCPEHVASPWLSRLSRFPPTYSYDTLAVVGTWSFARVASWGRRTSGRWGRLLQAIRQG